MATEAINALLEMSGACVRVRNVPNAGRSLFAQERIAAGEVVLEETPLALWPSVSDSLALDASASATVGKPRGMKSRSTARTNGAPSRAGSTEQTAQGAASSLCAYCFGRVGAGPCGRHSCARLAELLPATALSALRAFQAKSAPNAVLTLEAVARVLAALKIDGANLAEKSAQLEQDPGAVRYALLCGTEGRDVELSGVGIAGAVAALEKCTAQRLSASQNRVQDVCRRAAMNSMRVELSRSPDSVREAKRARRETAQKRETADGLPSSLCALPLLIAMANHECDPSAHVVAVAPESGPVSLQLRASRAIEAGEQVSLSYCGPGMGFAQRRARLREHWGFDCECSMCLIEKTMLQSRQ